MSSRCSLWQLGKAIGDLGDSSVREVEADATLERADESVCWWVRGLQAEGVEDTGIQVTDTNRKFQDAGKEVIVQTEDIIGCRIQQGDITTVVEKSQLCLPVLEMYSNLFLGCRDLSTICTRGKGIDRVEDVREKTSFNSQEGSSVWPEETFLTPGNRDRREEVET